MNYSAIHFAAWHGHRETVKILLEAGGQYDEQSEDRNTPLAFAANGGHLQTMKLFLPLGCDVNNADKDNDTPLHYAAYNGMTEGVQLLIEYGANPDVRNRVNASPLWNAVFRGHHGIVKELLEANVNMELTSRGRDPSPSDIDVYFYSVPRSPLFVATDTQRRDIVMLLIAAGYNVHKETWLLDGDIPYREENTELIGEVSTYIQAPSRLLTLCRNFFRSWFGFEVGKNVDKLDIPGSLKDYLKLKHLTEDANKMSIDSFWNYYPFIFSEQIHQATNCGYFILLFPGYKLWHYSQTTWNIYAYFPEKIRKIV